MAPKDALKKLLPRPFLYLYRFLRDQNDAASVLRFLWRRFPDVSFAEKLRLVYRFYIISDTLESPHTQDEILRFATEILSIAKDSPGVILEAGCFKGASTAKFSLVASIAGRRLLIFDSFAGIPENDEHHGTSIFGESVGFPEASYAGALEEVKENVSRFGDIQVCQFFKGWFDDTLPHLDEPLAAAYIDVDLASSTRTCIKYIYPLLIEGGALYSQDGHLPLVIEVFNDKKFWAEECSERERPDVIGLGTQKLVFLRKNRRRTENGRPLKEAAIT